MRKLSIAVALVAAIAAVAAGFGSPPGPFALAQAVLTAQEPAEQAEAEAPEPVAPEPAEEEAPAEESESAPADQEAAEEPEPLEQEAAEEPEPVEPKPASEPEPEPEPENAAEPESVPEPEPLSLDSVWGSLQDAIDAEADHQDTVSRTTGALEEARRALVEAEGAHASAMEGQGERNQSIRGAAQALVDFITAVYLTPAAQ